MPVQGKVSRRGEGTVA
uniref:Uncharacterized protein n=1 Tax=Anguilla anguilla TaxID=7936 RepID=A0A0E9ULH6_ANGAN